MRERLFAESVVEEAALEWLAAIGYAVLGGPEIAPNGTAPERADYRDVVLADRLGEALERINPGTSAAARAEAFRAVIQIGAPALVQANRTFHNLLVNGIAVDVLRDGEQVGELIRLIDFDDAVEQRLAGGQPVHGGRGQHRAAAGHRPLRQRAAAGRDRAQEHRRRGRHGRDRLQPAARPTSSRSRGSSTTNEILVISDGARRSWAASPRRGSASPPGRRSMATTFVPMANLEVGDQGRVRARPVARPDPLLHRLRGRRQDGRQEGRAVPPVPRRAEGDGDRAGKRSPCGATARAACSGTPRARASR